MSIGRVARSLLGERLFHLVARLYVRCFGNYKKIAAVIVAAIPPGAQVLDIGGGDGAPLNLLLAERPDVRVIMIDIAREIGGAVSGLLRSQVETLPQTSVAEYNKRRADRLGAILVLDVMHHIPSRARASFLQDLRALLLERAPPVPVIFKDIEPDGSLAARLNYLADRFISNDRNTTPIGRVELAGLLRAQFGHTASIKDTGLYAIEAPHYALIATMVER